MPRFWDTVMLRDELDMLEVRLAEFGDRDIAGHVIAEAASDHRGNPKPLHYLENRERFSAWSDRIIHVVADLPEGGDAWGREHAQRSAIWKALGDAGAQPEDTVLIADVDEFPPAEAFTRLPDPVLAHEQRLAMYAVDWLYPGTHLCSVTARLGWARSLAGCRRCARPGCATAVRDARNRYPRIAGGWHLTWLGGLEGQREKLRATCHTEMTRTEYDRIWSGDCYLRGFHHGDSGLMMIPADADETWPRMIFERKVPANWFRPRPEAGRNFQLLPAAS